ncbi:MAG: putative Fe-S cluster assembly protein SufT [Oleiphilus sp.]|nr:MAG: putative Fe-S cluster assembly protein SufT [Oleiphilus sp.]
MHEREVVVTKRECEARLVPAGTEIMIPKGSFVTITQALGGTFTVAVNGNLARIEGKDADALGKTVELEEFETPADGSVNEKQVWAAIRQCYDPEIPVNVVELGLIYDCQVITNDAGEHIVQIKMTLTAPGCGMGPAIVEDVRSKVSQVPGVSGVDVELVFDPPWNNDMLSDEAKLELGLL